MKTFSHSTFTIFLVLLGLISGQLFAQAEPESANVLEFQSRRVPMTKVVAPGCKFAYSLHGSNRIFRGELEEIRDTSLVINGYEIGISQFHMMEARNRKRQQEAGSIMIWSTAIMLLVVGGLIFSLLLGQANQGPGQGGFGGGPGAFIGAMVLGVVTYLWQILMIVGAFLYTFGRKRFDLKRYWDVKIVPKSGGNAENSQP